jgi:hypothetical protein
MPERRNLIGAGQNPIELIMTDGSQFQVSPRVLDVLLESRRVLKFRRAGGWVTIGIDAVRGRHRMDYCYLYDGPEKRATS